MSQVGISGQFALPNYIAQVLLDHNKATHDPLGIERDSLTGLQLPIGRFWINGDQTIPNNVITKILYDDKSFESGVSFNYDGIASSFTCAIPGKYWVYALATFESLSNNCILDLYVYFNGGIEATKNVKKGESSNYALDIAHCGHIAIGDVLDIRVKHTHGSNRVLLGTESQNYVMIHRLGD